MNVLQRAMQQAAASHHGSRFFRITRIDLQDRLVHLATGGRTTITGALAGFPTVWVTTTGRRTGRPHTRPLIGITDPDRPGALGLIASNFGQDHDPDWCANLRATPEAVVRAGDRSARYRAREVSGRDLERWFTLGTALYTGYPGYRERAARRIPVFELVPEEAAVPEAAAS